MKTISIRSHAKLNLILDVIRKRPDGYHDVKTILQKIELHDKITITKQGDDIKITCSNPKVPTDERNLAYKAAKIILKKYGIDTGIRIDIEKSIPIASGLGGGSSNAAAVLLGLNELFDLSISVEELFEAALSIGVDVPFFLQDKPCLATGKGEKLKPFNSKPNFNIVLVIPHREFSEDFRKTTWAYRMIDNVKNIIHPNTDKMVESFKNEDWAVVVKNFGNVFEQIISEKFGIVEVIKKNLIEQGCLNASMTGTGPSVFGVLPKDEDKKNKIYINMRNYGEVILTRTI